MTIAEELTARLIHLASIGDNWVTGTPHQGQSCAVIDATTGPKWTWKDGLRRRTRIWLDEFTLDYSAGFTHDFSTGFVVTEFNDFHDRTERIWWLQEAIAAAEEEGV